MNRRRHGFWNLSRTSSQASSTLRRCGNSWQIGCGNIVRQATSNMLHGSRNGGRKRPGRPKTLTNGDGFMKRLILGVCAIIGFASPQNAVMASPAADDLIRMARSGVDEEVLSAYIDASPDTYDLSADDIITLRAAESFKGHQGGAWPRRANRHGRAGPVLVPARGLSL